MQAMVLYELGKQLKLMEVPTPSPKAGQVLVKVSACGVCRTDLHLIDGELPNPSLPIIPGHEIVGKIVEMGSGITDFYLGQRVGIPWLGLPVVIALIALWSRRTSAINRASPVIKSMAGMQN